MIQITSEILVGVWENENVVPFSQDEKLYLTFYIGDHIISISKEYNKGETEIIASGNFHIEQKENDKFDFKIQDDGELKTIKCRMFLGNRPESFVASIEPYGEIYFQKK